MRHESHFFFNCYVVLDSDIVSYTCVKRNTGILWLIITDETLNLYSDKQLFKIVKASVLLFIYDKYRSEDDCVVVALWVLFVFHWFQNLLTWKWFDWLANTMYVREKMANAERRWPTLWKWNFCQFMIRKGTYGFRFSSWINVIFTLFGNKFGFEKFFIDAWMFFSRNLFAGRPGPFRTNLRVLFVYKPKWTFNIQFLGYHI